MGNGENGLVCAVGPWYSHSIFVRPIDAVLFGSVPVTEVSTANFHHLPPCLFSIAALGARSPAQTMIRLQSQRRRRAGGRDQQVRIIIGRNSSCSSSFSSVRYCIQAAATQGMAAHTDTKNCPTHSVHHRYHICSYRRFTGLGKQFGVFKLLRIIRR
jgi:hypothetical protein